MSSLQAPLAAEDERWGCAHPIAAGVPPLGRLQSAHHLELLVLQHRALRSRSTWLEKNKCMWALAGAPGSPRGERSNIRSLRGAVRGKAMHARASQHGARDFLQAKMVEQRPERGRGSQPASEKTGEAPGGSQSCTARHSASCSGVDPECGAGVRRRLGSQGSMAPLEVCGMHSSLPGAQAAPQHTPTDEPPRAGLQALPPDPALTWQHYPRWAGWQTCR